jgi:hypothetical protein
MDSPLDEDCNKYGNLARDVLAGLMLSATEKSDLSQHVQAPVASLNDIMAYIQTISSERSQRRNIRSSMVVDAVNTPSESATMIQQQQVREKALTCPPITCSPSFVREETLVVESQQPRGLWATSPASPLAPRTLLPPTTPQSEIVTTPGTIVQILRQRFRNHLERGHAWEEFLHSKGVDNAWKSLVRVHGLNDPIPLAYHEDENVKKTTGTGPQQQASYWLFFCKCGDSAEVGQALKRAACICSKCSNDKRKERRRHTQISKNSQELASSSSRAPYSSLATPLKLLRYQNVRKLANAEKRRNVHLEEVLSKHHAKTLETSDEKASELVSAASQFFF